MSLWCDMKGVIWRVWHEGCDMKGVIWRVWYEGCDMKGVTWRVWHEGCDMKGVTWRVWYLSLCSALQFHNALYVYPLCAFLFMKIIICIFFILSCKINTMQLRYSSSIQSRQMSYRVVVSVNSKLSRTSQRQYTGYNYRI